MNKETIRSRFRPGEWVVVLRDIANDGSYRSFQRGDLLAGEGERGEILGVGYQEEKARVVYFVALSADNRVIGCFEEDLHPATRKVRITRRQRTIAPRKDAREGVCDGRDL